MVRVTFYSSMYLPSTGLLQVRTFHISLWHATEDTRRAARTCQGCWREPLRSSRAMEQTASREGGGLRLEAQGGDCAPLLVVGNVLARDGQP